MLPKKDKPRKAARIFRSESLAMLRPSARTTKAIGIIGGTCTDCGELTGHTLDFAPLSRCDRRSLPGVISAANTATAGLSPRAECLTHASHDFWMLCSNVLCFASIVHNVINLEFAERSESRVALTVP